MHPDVLPFPDGLPDPSQDEETLLYKLNQGAYTAEQLARVDDFLVRALFERKYASKVRIRTSEAQKFVPLAPRPNAMALKVSQSWTKVSAHPLRDWTKQARAIWSEVLEPMLDNEVTQSSLQFEDDSCFVKCGDRSPHYPAVC